MPRSRRSWTTSRCASPQGRAPRTPCGRSATPPGTGSSCAGPATGFGACADLASPRPRPVSRGSDLDELVVEPDPSVLAEREHVEAATGLVAIRPGRHRPCEADDVA